MEFSVGDKVSFLNEKGGGVIKQVNNKFTVTVTTSDGFDIPYLKNELVLIEKAPQPPAEEKKEEPPKKYSEKELKQSLFQKYVKQTPVKRSKPHAVKSTMEVDLHIEELVEDLRGLSNFQIVSIQIDAFHTALQNAIDKKAYSLVVIHGVGNGVLKNEICKIIKNEYGFRYQDASLARYGKGATEVLIG